MPDWFAIILAAGGSSRMGRPKALLNVDGIALVVRHVQALQDCAPVVVVGHEHHRVHNVLGGTQTVINARWAVTHPSDSVRMALAENPTATGVLVTPVDVPPVAESTLRVLFGRSHSAVPVGEDGVEGHPVWVTGDELAALRQQPVQGGLRALLSGVARVSVPGVLGGDFDDPASFQAFLDR